MVIKEKILCNNSFDIAHISFLDIMNRRYYCVHCLPRGYHLIYFITYIRHNINKCNWVCLPVSYIHVLRSSRIVRQVYYDIKF